MIVEETVVIPDSIEPVEGWKLLRIKRPGARILCSPQQKHFNWEPQEKAVASCIYGRHPRGGDTPAPAEDCTCGIYMVSTPSRAMDYYDITGKFALVKLKGWGKVVPASHGARVQYSYPAEIYLIDSDEESRRKFEFEWGVPTKLLTYAEAHMGDELLLPKGPLRFHPPALVFMAVSALMFLMNLTLFVTRGYEVVEAITTAAWGITLAITTWAAFVTRTRKLL